MTTTHRFNTGILYINGVPYGVVDSMDIVVEEETESRNLYGMDGYARPVVVRRELAMHLTMREPPPTPRGVLPDEEPPSDPETDIGIPRTVHDRRNIRLKRDR